MYFAAPGLIVNTLFFVQGIGTTGSQMILGQVVDWLSLVAKDEPFTVYVLA